MSAESTIVKKVQRWHPLQVITFFFEYLRAERFKNLKVAFVEPSVSFLVTVKGNVLNLTTSWAK